MWRQSSDVWIGGAIAVLAAIVLLILIPAGVVVPDGMPPTATSPSFWPRATAWMLVLFGVVIALEGAAKTQLPSSDVVEDTNPKGIRTGGLGHAIFGFACLFGLWATIGWIGLPVACAVMTLGLGLLFGERRLWLLAAISVLVPAALYYFFTAVANVPIPLGTFFE